jgi:hypothetical protein
VTHSTFQNINSLNPISLSYSAQLVISSSLVQNIDAHEGSVVSGEFNEFSSFYTVYRNLTCQEQVFKIHTLLSAVGFQGIEFHDLMASSVLLDELQGAYFLDCLFNLTTRSAGMTLYIISGKPVTMQNCYITGSLKLLVDGESTEGVIPFTNLTLSDVKADGLLSSLQFSIQITNCLFQNVYVANAQRYLVNLA